MRVSLAISPNPSLPDKQAENLSRPLLNEIGPRLVLGGQDMSTGLAEPIVPSAETLFGPRGAALASNKGPLVVADTGHHRLLIWTHCPQSDRTPADLVIGQTDFASEGRNAKGPPSAATLNVPTGVTIEGNTLAVADAWNHRVLIWTSLPTQSNQPADLVLGQDDFESVQANRGGEVGANTLNWCYGVTLINGRLFVADTGNRRVLVWDQIPVTNGQPADHVLGQADFTCRDENAGADGGPLGMRWPHGVTIVGTQILVSDAGNNRVMVWATLPDQPGVACDFVLGQKNMASLEHNRGRYWPDAASLNMPYAIAATDDLLLAADTANSRLIGWQATDLNHDAPATHLSAQPNFNAKGDNRWQMPVRDSLCWPYGLTLYDQTAVIADSGNNRVLLWELAP